MRYLGIDFGLKRVGLAQSEGQLASPWKVIEGRGLQDFVRQIEQLVNQEGFNKIVVGRSEGKIGQTTNGFVNLLKKSGLNVETVDETLSTKHGIKEMINMGIPREKRKINDAYSAAIILQDYLDTHTLSS